RIACLGWLYETARNQGAAANFVKKLREAKDNAGQNLRPLGVWNYFTFLPTEARQTLPPAMILARGTDPPGMLAMVRAIESRTTANTQVRRARGPAGGNRDLTSPLPAEQLELLEATCQKLKQVRPTWSAGAVQVLMTELKRAG